MIRRVAATLAAMVASASVMAAVKTERVEYRVGDRVMEGVLAVPAEAKGPLPGVLVVHEWWGNNDYATSRAKQLAQLGYAAFALDMYGKGKVTTDSKQAGEWAGAVKGDRAEMRRRAIAGLDAFKATGKVDPDRIAAIGYCFGGTTVLELARADAPVRGVVSFHGSLDAGKAANSTPIRPKVLVLSGADDPMAPPAQVEALEAEMKKGGATLKVVKYPGAVHSFTNPASGSDTTRGVAYNADADRKSWEEMKQFLAGVLAK
jgi:dienelactone hydrolase